MTSILVVEDDADIRETLVALLVDEGYEVTEAKNGRAAIELVRARLPSLVLVDLRMPEMSGWEMIG